MSQAGWEAVWDRFNDEVCRIAAAGQECNPGLYFVCEHFDSPAFLFDGYAAFSLTPAHEEDLVLSLGCWREGATVRLSADIARHGGEVLADAQVEVETERDSPFGSSELQVAVDEAVAFFGRHLDLILADICPGKRQ
jgi:hypothetical protein